MKKTIKIISIVSIIIFIGLFAVACKQQPICLDDSYSLIRIHIRANSNEKIDQNVKLKVRDKVVEYLDKELKDIFDFDVAYDILEKNLKNIEDVCDKALKNNNFNYSAHAKMNNEYFPTRDYDGVVVLSGYYDALIIELGSGSGNNWWCVIYPPMCFLKNTASSSIRYKSFIFDFLKKYFDF